MSIDKNLEILEDGKNNWKNKKQDNLIIANSFLRLARKFDINSFYNINYNMLQCANYLEFKFFEDKTKKLHNASFCKNRLCPMCNWRRSKKIFGQVAKIVDELDKTNNYDYIFLTLTLKNCNGNELGDSIDLISKSFNRMFSDNRKVKNICEGYFRSIEVTYNKKDNTYHPHIHCIIVVDKGYFSWRNEDYIKTEEWVSIWQYYLKVDYTPIVDVRKVKSKSYNNNGIIEISKYSGVAEISKYTVKSKDIIITRNNGDVNEELTDNNIYILHFALKGKRLVTFGGIMKELHKKLNLEDMNSDNVDLIRTDVEDDNNILNYIILKYKWSVGISNYKLLFN